MMVVGRDWWLLAALAAVGAIAALSCLWLMWRAPFLLEIDGNEGWNAWHAADAFAPRRLYPPITSAINNNYPPLSFLVLAALTPWFSNAIEAGRWLSIAAMTGIATSVFFGARALGVGRPPALLGAVWFFATITLGFPVYAGTNDPNLFGLALSAAGFVIVLRSANARGRYAGVALMAAAGFIKHNLITLPLATLWQVYDENPRHALRLALFGAALCLVMLAAARAVYGENLLPQMLASRALSPWTPLLSLKSLQWIAPVWLFWLFDWARGGGRDHSRRVVGRLGVLSFCAWAFWRMGAGVDDNVQFDLVFATALALAVVAQRLSGHEVATALLGAVVVTRLLVTPERGPWLFATRSDYRAEIGRRNLVAASEIARIAALPGPVVCSMQNVCFLAGKPFVFNDFAVEQSVATGRISAAEAEAEKSRWRFETIDPDAHWPANE